jgi:hypothetical protein
MDRGPGGAPLMNETEGARPVQVKPGNDIWKICEPPAPDIHSVEVGESCVTAIPLMLPPELGAANVVVALPPAIVSM